MPRGWRRKAMLADGAFRKQKKGASPQPSPKGEGDRLTKFIASRISGITYSLPRGRVGVGLSRHEVLSVTPSGFCMVVALFCRGSVSLHPCLCSIALSVLYQVISYINA